jgi:hypothetical protein
LNPRVPGEFLPGVRRRELHPGRLVRPVRPVRLVRRQELHPEHQVHLARRQELHPEHQVRLARRVHRVLRPLRQEQQPSAAPSLG